MVVRELLTTMKEEKEIYIEIEELIIIIMVYILILLNFMPLNSRWLWLPSACCSYCVQHFH